MSLSTLFLGQHLIELEQVDSTNVYARQLLEASSGKSLEGTVVSALYQHAGKGQRGASWAGEPGMNIMMSLLFYPDFLTPREQFYLNMAVSLGVYDFMKALLTSLDVNVENRLRLKWPNDLYFENHKLGGILIENTIRVGYIQNAIVGIGINLNQLDFQNISSQATSVRSITGKEIDRMLAMHSAFMNIEARYLQLKAKRFDKIRADYLAVLYRYQVPAAFHTRAGLIKGQIVGVDEDGRLGISVEDKVLYFDLKEIRFVF